MTKRPPKHQHLVPRKWRILLTAGAAVFAIVVTGGGYAWTALQQPLHTVTAEKNAVIAKADAVKNTVTGLKTAVPVPTAATAEQAKFLTTVRSAVGGNPGTDAVLLQAGSAACTLSDHASTGTIVKVITFTDGALTAAAAGIAYQTAKTDLCQ